MASDKTESYVPKTTLYNYNTSFFIKLLDSAPGAEGGDTSRRDNSVHLQAGRRAPEEAGARGGDPGTVQAQCTAENRNSLGGKHDGATASRAAIPSLLADDDDAAAAAEVLRTSAAKDEQVLVPEAGGAARDGGGGVVALPHHPRGEHESEHRRGRLAQEVRPAVVIGQAEEEEERSSSRLCRAFGSAGPGAAASAASTLAE